MAEVQFYLVYNLRLLLSSLGNLLLIFALHKIRRGICISYEQASCLWLIAVSSYVMRYLSRKTSWVSSLLMHLRFQWRIAVNWLARSLLMLSFAYWSLSLTIDALCILMQSWWVWAFDDSLCWVNWVPVSLISRILTVLIHNTILWMVSHGIISFECSSLKAVAIKTSACSVPTTA